MKKNEAMLYCEYCDKEIIDHRNYIAILLGRRDNGIGVECDDCWNARHKKENELYEKEGFPQWVKDQHKTLSDASDLLKKFLNSGGAHFFPMEYDCYDLDSDIKNAKGKIDWLKNQTKKVFSRVFEEEKNG